MSLYGIDNTVDEAKDPYFKELLDKVPSEHGGEFIDEENYTQSEFVQEWRRLASFKTKRSPIFLSIEALLKRVHQGREFIRLILCGFFTIACRWFMPLWRRRYG